MGFLTAGPEAPPYEVVITVRGRLSGILAAPKGRVFVMVDRTLVVCLPADGGLIDRKTYSVVSSEYQAPVLTVTTADGDIVVDGSGCGCNFGAVGNAGPADGDYRLIKVRNPDWAT